MTIMLTPCTSTACTTWLANSPGESSVGSIWQSESRPSATMSAYVICAAP